MSWSAVQTQIIIPGILCTLIKPGMHWQVLVECWGGWLKSWQVFEYPLNAVGSVQVESTIANWGSLFINDCVVNIATIPPTLFSVAKETRTEHHSGQPSKTSYIIMESRMTALHFLVGAHESAVVMNNITSLLLNKPEHSNIHASARLS